MNSYYNYKKSICSLSEQQVLDALKAAELKSRSSKACYVDSSFFKDQADEIKSEWPAPLIESLRAKVKQTEKPISSEQMRRFCLETLIEACPSRKAYDSKAITAELALATLFKRAPSFLAPNSFRAYRKGGPVIGYKTSSRPGRLVVDKDKVSQAEVFVLCYHAEAVSRAMLLGWATQDDVRKMECGNMLTRPDCNWTKEAYFAPICELKPMTLFLNKFSIRGCVPSLVLFEEPPSLDDLPIEPNRFLQAMLEDSDKTNEGEDEKFLRDIMGFRGEEAGLPSGG